MRRLDTIYRQAQETFKRPQIRRRIKWGAVILLFINLIAWPFASYFISRPEIVRAALPTYVNAGAVFANAGSGAVGLPAGIAADDILLLFIETENQAVSVSAAGSCSTWAAVADSPQGTGTASATDAVRLTAYWCRYGGSGTTGPTISDSGDHQLARIIAVRGVITTGDPWDVTSGGVEAGNTDNSGVIPGDTTTGTDRFVVAAISTALPDSNGTAGFSSFANTDLANFAEQTDNTTNAGTGGGLGIATGEKAAQGAYGNTTVTTSTSTAKAYMTIALKPQPAAPLLTQTGYHWRNNDGDEAGATSRTEGAENTSITPNKNTTLRLRLQISNEGTANHSGAAFRIEYAQTATCSGGSYAPIPVTPTTEHFNMSDSTYVTDGTATTNIAVSTGGVTDANTTFDAGQFKDTGNTTASIALTTTEFTEVEYAITANDNSQWDTHYCFKVTDNGTDLDAYSQYAELTTTSQPPNLEQVKYRWRNDNGPEQGNPTDANEGPEGDEAVITGWTSPIEAYSLTDNNTYATAAPGKNNNISSNFTTFGFDTSLPSDANINTVTLTAQYKVSTDASVADLTVIPVVSGTDCGSGGNDASEPLSDYDFSTNVTSCRSWARDDLLDANFKVRVDAHRSNSNTAVTFSLDIVKVTVNYSTPGASFKQDENTPHSGQAKNENVRLRAMIKNTGGTISQGYRLQYVSKSAACNTITSGWTIIPVTATTEHFEFTTTTNFADQDSTLNINPGLSDPAGTFVSGYMTEDPSYMSNAISLTNGDFAELEYNFQANDSSSGTYCFRLVRGTSETELDTYTAFPELSVSGGNSNPDTPTNLGPAGYIDASGWTSDNTPIFNFDVTDPDPAEQVKYRIQIDDTAGFGSLVLDYQPSSYGAEGTYNYTVGQAGSYAVGSQGMTLSDSASGGGYYWRVMAIDDDSATSSWEEAGVDSTIDFRVDASAPTGGTVKDGTGSDQDWNDGSLTQISANWTGTTPNSDTSGLQKYEYAIRRQSDGYYWSVCAGAGTWQVGENWCNNNTLTTFTQNSLNLQTGVIYYVSLKTTDNAGNIQSAISSNGQQVLPELSYSIDSNSVTFADLGNINNWTDTEQTTITTSTNAGSGYVVRAYLVDLLKSIIDGDPIANFVGDNAPPASWADPDPWGSTCYAGGAAYCGYGYTSSDTSVQGSNRFAGGTEYAPYPTSPPGDIVADHTDAVNGSTGKVTNESFTITHKASVNTSQQAGKYQTTAYFIVTANY